MLATAVLESVAQEEKNKQVYKQAVDAGSGTLTSVVLSVDSPWLHHDAENLLKWMAACI